jgi:hypothetical protein
MRFYGQAHDFCFLLLPFLAFYYFLLFTFPGAIVPLFLGQARPIAIEKMPRLEREVNSSFLTSHFSARATMDIPINDPGFLGAIVGAVSGLLGAVIGGVLTYLGSTQLERQKAKELSKRLHCLLFDEISGHAVELGRDIDFVLPEWLHRGNSAIWNSARPSEPSLHLLFKYVQL